jgi:hypothetical protein
MAVAECRKRFDELMQSNIDWASGSGFFDIDAWVSNSRPSISKTTAAGFRGNFMFERPCVFDSQMNDLRRIMGQRKT